MTDKETLEGLVADAIEDLKDWVKDNPGEEPEGTIFEIIDLAVPVYDSALLQLGSDNWELMTNAPDSGLVGDNPTPINIIRANIYEHVEAKLWEWWNGREECWECDGTGEVDCPACLGEGCGECDDGCMATECEECGGTGYAE